MCSGSYTGCQGNIEYGNKVGQPTASLSRSGCSPDKLLLFGLANFVTQNNLQDRNFDRFCCLKIYIPGRQKLQEGNYKYLECSCWFGREWLRLEVLDTQSVETWELETARLLL